jgi:hypothetical protein
MEKLQVAKKHRLELDWILIMSTDKDQSFKYLKLSDYKMTCSHSAVRRCNVHPNTDLHKMSVSYYRCTSRHCVQGEEDKCEFRNCVKQCHKEQMYHIYKVYNHII